MKTKGTMKAAIKRARLRKEVAAALAQAIDWAKPAKPMTKEEAFRGFTDEPPTPDEAREAIKDSGGF